MNEGVVAGIDSMVLIYAEAVPSSGAAKSNDFDDLRLRAKLLLEIVHSHNGTIILPGIAVSELLIPVPSARKGSVIAALEKHFVVAPFDLPAASIAAELIAQRDKIPQNQKYDKRHVLKADAMIIASAKAAGATEFYTHDKKCRALASLIMPSFDLPTGKGKHDMIETFIASDIKDGNS